MKQTFTNSKRKIKLAPGEFAFACVLLILGIIALALSINLFSSAEENRFASAGALPLLVSIIWVALSVYLIVKELLLREKSEESFTERIKNAIYFVFPKNIIVTIITVILYCFVLLLGLNFYIASALFLWGLMSYLSKGNLLKNILWTAIIIVILFLIFGLAFGVALI